MQLHGRHVVTMKIDDRQIAHEPGLYAPLPGGEGIVAKRARITSAQIRAARGLLNLSARRLAEQSGVSQSTIHRAETAEAVPGIHQASLTAVKATLEEFGVEFLDDSGVRLRSRRMQVERSK
jgi:Helix-turn-helix domain